jgi:hypothetical protein
MIEATLRNDRKLCEKQTARSIDRAFCFWVAESFRLLRRRGGAFSSLGSLRRRRA